MRYPAFITHEGDATLVEFPDAPGCQTFTRGKQVRERAREAIEGWLEAQLEDRETPPRPSGRVTPPKGAALDWIAIDPILGVRLTLRWAREDAGMTQAALAKKMGISQQAYAKLESPDANLTMETLERAAKALGMRIELELVPRASGEATIAR